MRPAPDDARLDAWLTALPKPEMPVHFEGAFRWSTIRALHPDGAAPRWPRGWLDGIDLHGDERLGDHRAFVRIYERAAAAGLKLRAHAGELCGPDNVRAAVTESGVRDVSHGVRALEDPALVRARADRGVFLHVCPTSNVRLGCASSHREHPLRALVRAGVRCTVNSDNPLLFATDVVQEYRHAVREMGFSPADVAEFARNGFRASLLPRDRVQALCAEIDTLLPEGALAMAMTFGIHIGHMGGPLDEMRKLWRFADAQGFDWFSVSDHFQESPPQGGELDCYEAISTLTAAAMETKRVRLGSLVYCVVYRNPGLLAKSLTTIDHLSGGRVDCGLGAGWHGIEATAYGYPFPSIGPREDMLEEYAQIVRMLFDPEGRRTSFVGKHFNMQNAPNNPKPLQPRIPIWIGGRGEKRTLRAAAKFADGWNAPYIGPDEWKHKSNVLDQWCQTEKRDPKTIARTVNLGFYLGADARGAARGEEIYNRHWGNRTDGRETRTGWLRGTPKDVMDMIGQFRDLGCSRLNIAFREGPYDWDALQAFADEVMPKFGAKKPR